MTRPRLRRRDPWPLGTILTLQDGTQYIHAWHSPRVAWARIVDTLSCDDIADLADQIIHVGSIR